MASNATALPSVRQPARPAQGAYDRPSYTMVSGSRIVINDGYFAQTTSAPAENRGFRLLAKATSPSAFHNASHLSLPMPHSDTQAAAFDRIKVWILDNTAAPVMWLYGAEGTGKSSLAQSIALWSERESLLLASFFFSRSDPSRNSTHHFIPTLAYNIIQVIPESRHMIEQAVDSDPHIFSRSLDAQISRLVLRPLLTLAQALPSNVGRPFPHVLVIDGLDHCDETAQKTILRLFSSGFGGWDLGWRVLITSLPEQAIRISFDSMALSTRLALRRKLVLAFDVGTTHSGISYSILDPRQMSEISSVTRFPAPALEHIAGTSKIPSVIYYDRSGHVRAVGAEATTEEVDQIAEEGGWIKAEWFKLHLRNKFSLSEYIREDFPPLPLNKSVVQVFADFLEYLIKCAEFYIKETHAAGTLLWESIKNDINFVLSHSDGWEEAHWRRQEMRRAAVLAKLIPDTASGHARLSFVAEGEANLHFSIKNGLPPSAMKNRDSVVIVEAGEGAININSYCRKNGGEGFAEIAAPQCHFHGSDFVTSYARTFVASLLDDSPYIDDLDDIVDCFDKTTKPRFRDSTVAQYVKFGSVRDTDLEVGIRFGQLKIEGSDVATFFEPSIDCIVNAVLDLRKIKAISHVVLLGSFSASDWLYNSVRNRLEDRFVSVIRPDSNTNHNAVSDGAISFYLSSSANYIK